MSISNSHIRISKFGNWNGVIRAFSQMGFEIEKAARNGQVLLARRYIGKVKNHILNQDMGWPAVSDSTQANKSGNLTLIDTRLYFESINYWWENKVIKAGVKRQFHYENGLEISRVAAWHEFGTNNMPRRPVWGPTIEEMDNDGDFENVVADAIVRSLQRSFAGTPAQITRDWVLSYYG